jgi:hypothetical protein
MERDFNVCYEIKFISKQFYRSPETRHVFIVGRVMVACVCACVCMCVNFL